MKFKAMKLSVLLILFMSWYSVNAQPTELIAVPATGGDISGSGGSINYTIGQVVYTTNIVAGVGNVAQGVQQAYDISVIFNYEGIDAGVFPNPTTDRVILKINNFDITDPNYQGMHYYLYNLNGKPLLDGEILSGSTSLTMGYLPCATYILNIVKTENGSTSEKISFKIIKY